MYEYSLPKPRRIKSMTNLSYIVRPIVSRAWFQLPLPCLSSPLDRVNSVMGVITSYHPTVCWVACTTASGERKKIYKALSTRHWILQVVLPRRSTEVSPISQNEALYARSLCRCWLVQRSQYVPFFPPPFIKFIFLPIPQIPSPTSSPTTP